MQTPRVQQNRRIEGLSPSIAVLEKVIAEYDRESKILSFLTPKDQLSLISNSDLRAIARFVPQLKELTLNCTAKLSVTEEGLEALAKRCSDLRDLKLFGFELSERSLQALATHCPQLSSIWSGQDKVEWRREASSEVGGLEG